MPGLRVPHLSPPMDFRDKRLRAPVRAAFESLRRDAGVTRKANPARIENREDSPSCIRCGYRLCLRINLAQFIAGQCGRSERRAISARRVQISMADPLGVGIERRKPSYWFIVCHSAAGKEVKSGRTFQTRSKTIPFPVFDLRCAGWPRSRSSPNLTSSSLRPRQKTCVSLTEKSSRRSSDLALEGRARRTVMSEVVQLKFTVSRIDNIIANEELFGLVFYDFVLAKKSEDIITDRILEGVWKVHS